MKSKKTLFILLVISAMTLPFQGNAQFILGKQKARFSGFKLNIGGSFENYANLSGEGLFSMLRPNQTSSFDISNYREIDYGYGAIMEGNYLGFDLIFNPKNSEGNVRLNREIRVGAQINIGREILIDMSPNGVSIDPIGLCLIENNFNLNASYLFRTTNKIFNAYAGPGANIGGTFGNDFIFMGSGDQTFYKAYGSNYLRVYALAGISMNLARVSFHLEGNYGFGSQVVHNGDVNLLQTYGLQASIGYRFK